MIMIELLSSASEAVPIAHGSGPYIPWGRIVLSFLFCIVLAVGAIGFIRARNGMPVVPDRWRSKFAQDPGKAERTKTMQIVQRLSVTPTSQLVLLSKGSQSYLLHLTNQGATVIDRFSEDEESGL